MNGVESRSSRCTAEHRADVASDAAARLPPLQPPRGVTLRQGHVSPASARQYQADENKTSSPESRWIARLVVFLMPGSGPQGVIDAETGLGRGRLLGNALNEDCHACIYQASSGSQS